MASKFNIVPADKVQKARRGRTMTIDPELYAGAEALCDVGVGNSIVFEDMVTDADGKQTVASNLRKHFNLAIERAALDAKIGIDWAEGSKSGTFYPQVTLKSVK